MSDVYMLSSVYWVSFTGSCVTAAFNEFTMCYCQCHPVCRHLFTASSVEQLPWATPQRHSNAAVAKWLIKCIRLQE